MQTTTECFDNFEYPALPVKSASPMPDILSCNWQALQTQLLQQWPRVTDQDLKVTGPYRHRIATLIGERYNIAAALIEHYLRNFEHTIYSRLCLLHGYKVSDELRKLQEAADAKRRAIRREIAAEEHTVIAAAAPRLKSRAVHERQL